MATLLRGEESLATAFWLVGLAYILVAVGLVALGILSQSIFFLILCFVCILAFFIFYQVSIWKCANNTSWIGWTNLARTIVILRALVFPISFFIKFFISTDLGNTIDLFALGVEAVLAITTLLIFAAKKLNKSELSQPLTLKSNQNLDNESFLKDAKTKFLSGDYDGALVLFRTAESIQPLDENSNSFKTMCMRRLAKAKPLS
ncbi:hypothetical protein NBRC116188_28810 [Oceaniserpentilla sp. 4NH20-0058]|uniref:hypothetical protein n=1 Tax=Oceaniserpentilla sp. 4NH20-0058 TaxID=3127660 RepID=UPI00310AD617